MIAPVARAFTLLRARSFRLEKHAVAWRFRWELVAGPSASSAIPLDASCWKRSVPGSQHPNRSTQTIQTRTLFRLAFGYGFDTNMKPAGEDAVRIWPWRDAKLTKAVNDQASCINMSSRR